MKIEAGLLIKDWHQAAIDRFWNYFQILGDEDYISRAQTFCDTKSPYEDICIHNGYRYAMSSPNITHIQKSVTSLEKALHYYCERATDIDFVFLFEEDCFIPTKEAAQNLIEKYSCHDLVIASHKAKTNRIPDWHWGNIFQIIEPPYFHSMACCVGLSRKMLNVIRDYARKHKTLFYHEVMFNTLAARHGLSICTPEELRTIVWQGAWGLDDIMQRPLNIFHPIKNLDNHIKLRQLVIHAQYMGYEPVDKLPNFVKYTTEEMG